MALPEPLRNLTRKGTFLIVRVLFGVLACAPAGVGVGLWLAVNTGVGVVVGSGLYGGLALYGLVGDVWPDKPVTR